MTNQHSGLEALEEIEFLIYKMSKWTGIDMSELDDEFNYSENVKVIRKTLKEDE